MIKNSNQNYVNWCKPERFPTAHPMQKNKITNNPINLHNPKKPFPKLNLCNKIQQEKGTIISIRDLVSRFDSGSTMGFFEVENYCMVCTYWVFHRPSSVLCPFFIFRAGSCTLLTAGQSKPSYCVRSYMLPLQNLKSLASRLVV